MAKKKTLTDQYQDHLLRIGRSPRTVKAYAHDLAVFARWFKQTTGEAFHPRALDPRDVQEYKGYLVQNGLKPATINRRLIALGRFFRWAKQEDLVDAGVPLDQVATLMGHETLETTKVYTRPIKRDLERAVRRAAGEI